MLIFSEHKLKSGYTQENPKNNYRNQLKIGRHRFSGTAHSLLLSEFCGNQVLMLIFNEHKQKSTYSQKNAKNIHRN